MCCGVQIDTDTINIKDACDIPLTEKSTKNSAIHLFPFEVSLRCKVYTQVDLKAMLIFWCHKVTPTIHYHLKGVSLVGAIHQNSGVKLINTALAQLMDIGHPDYCKQP